jgi:hypothetical protein
VNHDLFTETLRSMNYVFIEFVPQEKIYKMFILLDIIRAHRSLRITGAVTNFEWAFTLQSVPRTVKLSHVWPFVKSLL